MRIWPWPRPWPRLRGPRHGRHESGRSRPPDAGALLAAGAEAFGTRGAGEVVLSFDDGTRVHLAPGSDRARPFARLAEELTRRDLDPAAGTQR